MVNVVIISKFKVKTTPLLYILQTHHTSVGDGNTREKIFYKFFDKQNQASISMTP